MIAALFRAYEIGILVFAALFIMNVLPSRAALNVPVSVRDALYTGSPGGVARSNVPFCSVVSLRGSAAIAGPHIPTATGAAAGELRLLAKWSSVNYKWIKLCGILPALAAGGVAVTGASFK